MVLELQIDSIWQKKMALMKDALPLLFGKESSSPKQKILIEVNERNSRRIDKLTKHAPVVKVSFFLSCLGILVWKLTNYHQVTMFLSHEGNLPFIPIYSELHNTNLVKSYLGSMLRVVKKSMKEIDSLSPEAFAAFSGQSELRRMLIAVRSFYDNFKGFSEAELSHSQLLLDIDDRVFPYTISLYVSESLPAATRKAFVSTLDFMIGNILDALDQEIRQLPLTTEVEQDRLIETGWNDVRQGNKTVTEMLNDICKKYPDKAAIRLSYDTGEINELLNHPDNLAFSWCCFTPNNPLFIKEITNFDCAVQGYDSIVFIKTSRNDSAIVNTALISLIQSLKGNENILAIQNIVKQMNLVLMADFLDRENSKQVVSSYVIDVNSSLQDIMALVKALLEYHILRFRNITPLPATIQYQVEPVCSVQLTQTQHGKKDIVIFGDTPNNSSVGILYLASYLVRNGISAYCNYSDNNWRPAALENDVRNLVSSLQPRVVAVSMKWFPHIQRVLEILQTVKRLNPGVITVVGGDTASWFYRELVEYSCIDYVVRGDGELPLLHICKGDLQDLPNCAYKLGEEIIERPITYVQHENTDDLPYLSHLKDYLPDKFNFYANAMFIYTHKGCTGHCIYCGGRLAAQTHNFCRTKLAWRPAVLVNNDIMQLYPYVSTFMFDLEQTDYLLEYLKDIWKGIDLSNHFCVLFFTAVPDEEIVRYVSSRFAYVRWNLDLCSLSENHRMMLQNKGLIKHQPTNRQIGTFFDFCETIANVEVDINTITGLPWMSAEDFQAAEDFLEHIRSTYSVFSDIHWGRLHSQPGDAISMHANQYQMISHASSFQDFLKFSKMNYHTEGDYPNLENYKYPFILYQDAQKNADLIQHFNRLKTIMSKPRNQNGLLFSQLSYRELDRRSNQLAHAFICSGIKSGQTITICFDNPILQTIAIYAVIKVGAAYLLLNPDEPLPRLSYKLKTARTSMLVYDCLQKGYSPPVHSLDLTLFDWDDQATDFVACQHDTKDPIYIIYTSGSTGQPKGVEVTAVSLANYITWRKKQYGHLPEDKTLSLLSSSFDGYFSNFFGSLMTGGTLYIASNNHRRDIATVINILEQESITNMSLVPSLYREILNQANPGQLCSLRQIVLGGEKADPSMIEQSKQAGIHLINEYGPTECTIAATCNMDLTADQADEIGYPIDAVGVYVLNQDLNLMPVGFQGEIYISGAGVAKGYLDTETEESPRFTADPFKGGMRMFRTGDIGIRNSNGSFRILGRVDSQVKVSGYRIELGEIETSILKLNDIDQAAVIAKTKGQLTLIYAFITSRQTIVQAQIKNDLLNYLPQYMIPNFFTQVKTIPFTASGKVDRDALWGCLKEAESNSSCGTNPKSGFENKILELWQDVLGTQLIRLDDNFFEAGGSSIQLIQLHEKLNQQFANKFSVTDLFSYPTIRLQSIHLEQTN